MSLDCLYNFIEEISEHTDLRVVQVSICIEPKIFPGSSDFKEACFSCIFPKLINRII